MIGFILSNPADADTFVQAGRTLHRNRNRTKRTIRPEILHWDSDASLRRTREKDLGKTLADNDHVVAFAYGADAFPPIARQSG